MVFSHSNRKVADTDEKLTCIGHFPLNWFAFEPSRQQAGKGSTEPSHTPPFAQGACQLPFPVGIPVSLYVTVSSLWSVLGVAGEPAFSPASLIFWQSSHFSGLVQ